MQLLIKGGLQPRRWECYTSLGFPSGSNGKEDACNVEGSGSIPGSGRSPGKGTGKQPTPILPGESQEPGRLQSMGSIRVRHDGKTNPHTHTRLVSLDTTVPDPT